MLRFKQFAESTVLYHATSKKNARKISVDGIQPVSYWSIATVNDYYEDTIRDEGAHPISFSVPLSHFNHSLLEPDMPGIEEPITTAIHKREKQVWSEWEKSTKDWRASLEIIGSVRYKGTIKV